MVDPRSLGVRLWRDRTSRAIAVRLIAVAVSLLQSIVVARLGGPELRGVVAVFISASSLIYLAASFDLGQQIVQMCRNRDDFTVLRPLMRATWLTYATIAALVAVAGLAIDSAVSWLAIGGIAYLIGSQALLVVGSIRGPATVAWSALAQQTVMLVGVVGVASAEMLNESTVKVVVIASFLAPVPAFWAMSLPHAKAPVAWRRIASDVGHAVVGGLPWQLGRALQWGLLIIDTILVAHYLGDAAAGVYAVGFSLTVVPRLVGGNIAIDVTHRATIGKVHALDRDLVRALWATAAAATATAVVAPFVINRLYGPDFADALPVYLVLTISVVAQAVVQVSHQFTRVYGQPWPTVAYSSLGPIIMLASGGWALTSFGVVGMAWVSGVASVIIAIPAVIVARRLARAN